MYDLKGKKTSGWNFFCVFLRSSSLNLASRMVVPTVCFFVGNLVCEIVFFLIIFRCLCSLVEFHGHNGEFFLNALLFDQTQLFLRCFLQEVCMVSFHRAALKYKFNEKSIFYNCRSGGFSGGLCGRLSH